MVARWSRPLTGRGKTTWFFGGLVVTRGLVTGCAGLFGTALYRAGRTQGGSCSEASGHSSARGPGCWAPSPVPSASVWVGRERGSEHLFCVHGAKGGPFCDSS